MTGTESVVNISVTGPQVTPQDTLRRNRCSASRAISIRRLLVSSRNRADPALGRGGPLGVGVPGRGRVGQRPYDGDLLAVDLDVGRGGEPVGREPAGEPGAHLRRGAGAAIRGRVSPASWPGRSSAAVADSGSSPGPVPAAIAASEASCRVLM